MFQHKALGNHMSAAVRGYSVSVSFVNDVYCPVCGHHRGSVSHRKQADKCSKILQKKYTE